ncbi:MAG: ABC transporter ATP-binding protein [Janthinobacterium lividum]
MEALLEIRNLNVRLPHTGGELHALRDLSLSVHAGETLCIVGESGCGKSLTLLSIMGLLPAGARTRAKTLRFAGIDLTQIGRHALEDLRGGRIGMVFQDALTAFNPTLPVGRQLTEVAVRHGVANRKQAYEKACDLLDSIGVTSPAVRMSQYPHELSGGLRQRAMLAMALMGDPQLLLADEPTTALDVTVQTQVLTLLKELQKRLGIAIAFVTHDLGVVAAIADRVAVMYAGEVVETGTVRALFRDPLHPYTQALFACVPQASQRGRLGSIPGNLPTLVGDLEGCAFRARCGEAIAPCAQGRIPLLHAYAPQAACRCLRRGSSAWSAA